MALNPVFQQPGLAVIARKHSFSAAHRYVQKRFSAAKNAEIFGPCFNENAHGHNYTIEAFVCGEIERNAGWIADLASIDDILCEVCRSLDHRNLNLDVEEFFDTVPTTENLALFFFKKIASRLTILNPELKLHRVRLFETDDLSCEVWA